MTLRCQFCQTPMAVRGSKGSPLRYYHCGGCGRWVASSYHDEAVKSGTAARHDPASPPRGGEDFERIKARMQRWMAALDEADPYQVMGVSPSIADEELKLRFRELALKHHPDRGGDPAQMRRVLEAWERIRRSRRLPAR